MQNSTHSTYIHTYTHTCTTTLQKQIGCFNHWVVTLVASWRDSGYESFVVIGRLFALCNPRGSQTRSSYNHNWQPSWRNHLLALKTWKFVTATLKCNDSFMYMYTQMGCFNHRMVTLVAWLILVTEWREEWWDVSMIGPEGVISMQDNFQKEVDHLAKVLKLFLPQQQHDSKPHS